MAFDITLVPCISSVSLPLIPRSVRANKLSVMTQTIICPVPYSTHSGYPMQIVAAKLCSSYLPNRDYKGIQHEVVRDRQRTRPTPKEHKKRPLLLIAFFVWAIRIPERLVEERCNARCATHPAMPFKVIVTEVTFASHAFDLLGNEVTKRQSQPH